MAYYDAVGELCLCYLTFWFAVRLPFEGFDRFGDFSYGMYIYAFPIEQLLSSWRVNNWGLAPYVAIALTLTMIHAVLSWFFVEKIALKYKNVSLRRILARWKTSSA